MDGAEARGGAARSEVILSAEPVVYPEVTEPAVMVAMSQAALDKYLPRLRKGGTLIFDPELVEQPERSDIHAIAVPATQTAGEIGLKLAANMVMLGFLQKATDLFTEEHLLDIVKDNVPARFVDLNLQAVKRGSALAKENHTGLEV